MKAIIYITLLSICISLNVFGQVGINTDTVTPGVALEVNGKTKIAPITTAAGATDKLLVVLPDGTIAQTNSGKVGISTVINKNIGLTVGNNNYGVLGTLVGVNMPFENVGLEKYWVTTNTFSPITNGSMRMQVNFVINDNTETGTPNNNGVVEVKPYLIRASDHAVISQSISSYVCYPCEDGTSRYASPTILADTISSSETYYLLFTYKILQQSTNVPTNRIAYDFNSVNIQIYQANDVEL